VTSVSLEPTPKIVADGVSPEGISVSLCGGFASNELPSRIRPRQLAQGHHEIIQMTNEIQGHLCDQPSANAPWILENLTWSGRCCQNSEG
jgi:hypothetical protein